MTPAERWLAAAVADVRARGLEGAVPALEAFARAMQVLRDADWNDDAGRGTGAARDGGGEVAR